MTGIISIHVQGIMSTGAHYYLNIFSGYFKLHLVELIDAECTDSER